MTDIWIPGMDVVIAKFDAYRDAQSAIRRASERLESCEPRQTAQYKADLIRAAQEVPELQRLIEREESIREEIVRRCHDAGDLMDEVYTMWGFLVDRYQRVIVQRYYFDCLTMPEVATEVSFNIRWCWQIRQDAFRTIAEKTARLCTV